MVKFYRVQKISAAHWSRQKTRPRGRAFESRRPIVLDIRGRITFYVARSRGLLFVMINTHIHIEMSETAKSDGRTLKHMEGSRVTLNGLRSTVWNSCPKHVLPPIQPLITYIIMIESIKTIKGWFWHCILSDCFTSDQQTLQCIQGHTRQGCIIHGIVADLVS